MASVDGTPALRPDEFAFYFETQTGIAAKDLGQLLQRAVTVSRRFNVVLTVSSVQPGSLWLILRVLEKTGIKGAGKEFKKSPLSSTAATLDIVTAVAGAIIYAMTPAPAKVEPISKTGASIIEQNQATQISVVTNVTNIVVMDRTTARHVREFESELSSPARLKGLEVQNLLASASTGSLEGDIVAVGQELYFKPSGHRYLVPVDLAKSAPGITLYPATFVVSGKITTTPNGAPDSIIIYSATTIGASWTPSLPQLGKP